MRYTPSDNEGQNPLCAHFTCVLSCAWWAGKPQDDLFSSLAPFFSLAHRAQVAPELQMLLHPGRPHDGGKAVLGDGRRDALHGLLRQGLPPATARGLACADVWLPPTDDGRQRMIMTGTSPLFSGPLIQRQTTSAPAPAPCGFHAFHVCRGSLCVSMTLDAPCWVSLLPSFLRTRRCATIWRKDFPWSRRTKMRATVKSDRRADPFTMAPPSRFPREVGGSTTTRDSAADTGARRPVAPSEPTR